METGGKIKVDILGDWTGLAYKVVVYAECGVWWLVYVVCTIILIIVVSNDNDPWLAAGCWRSSAER